MNTTGIPNKAIIEFYRNALYLIECECTDKYKVNIKSYNKAIVNYNRLKHLYPSISGVIPSLDLGSIEG